MAQKADPVDIASDIAADSIVVNSIIEATVVEEGQPALDKDFTIYDLPYSATESRPNWKQMWTNTAVLMGGGTTAMIVLEALPSESTAWNKSENAKVPMFKRWWRNVKAGPVWDKDDAIFDLILHPYAGAVYYMSARSSGFNVWGSFVYDFCISTLFWEYGFEAFNEIPSVQDLVITSVFGSALGEGFYVIKRHIVNNGYRLLGSKVLGYAVAFIIDPLNEVTGYFRGDQRHMAARADARRSSLSTSSWIAPSRSGLHFGLTLTYTF